MLPVLSLGSTEQLAGEVVGHRSYAIFGTYEKEQLNSNAQFDVLVVGASFTGRVVARVLAESGRHVRIIDRQAHLGGNAYDELDANGPLMHRYGPHVFRTNSRHMFEMRSCTSA